MTPIAAGPSVATRPPFHRLFQLAVLCLALAASLQAFFQYDRLDRALVTQASNTWFQADTGRVYGNMTDRLSEGHYRVKVHPLHSLGSFPPTRLLIGLGAAPYRAVQLVSAGVSALWLLLMVAVLRAMGCARLDSLLFASLGLVSAASLFWFSVPETYALGSASVLVCLLLAAQTGPVAQSTWAHLAANVLALSVTITNWMSALGASYSALGIRRALKVAALALALLTVLWGVQKHIFPSAVFFFGDREEANYLQATDVRRVIEVLTTFFFHTISAPAINVVGQTGIGWQMLSVQDSRPGSSGWVGAVSTMLWLALLVAGACALARQRLPGRLRFTLLASLAGQLALHLIYGEETFLYCLHFLPLLIVTAAAATLARRAARRAVMLVVLVCIPLLALNNWQQLLHAQSLAVSPRAEVLAAMDKRPQDHWPTGVGHVVLAQPGSREAAKAYHEPGGGFSPSPGSFGLSVWFYDSRGQVVASPSRLPMQQVRQSLQWPAGLDTAAILTETPLYQAEWKGVGLGRWQLRLTPAGQAGQQPALMLRSVGPAGGAVRDLRWDGNRLLVNERWALTFQPPPKAMLLGQEGPPSWHLAGLQSKHVTSKTGWAFARIDLSRDDATTVMLEDRQPQDDPWFSLPAADGGEHAGLQMSLPDERFETSLRAQAAHLLMGLVGQETRPGEPMNYPLAWQRDGAYVLAALTRLGHTDTARRLARQLAEKDFFGGFGPEADAPGLAIWSLAILARQLRDGDFDRWLWPHIQRKAEYILAMKSAQRRMLAPLEPPIVPAIRHYLDLRLVAEPSRDGLIVGKMDHQWPLLFINAVSYRGLMDAADIAHSRGEFALARRWLQEAESIKQAWDKAFTQGAHENERTYISALWPTWIAQSTTESLTMRLRNVWDQTRTADGAYRSRPLWTYFELAQAHQWLYLGQVDRVWTTLEWFWNNQASPGLYTWWEGSGEENSFGRWSNIRGWVRPQGVTPHYWTAAEMALLQLDILATASPGPIRTLVIGAGVPAGWTKRPMQVRGVNVDGIRVDWAWDTRKLVVHVDRAVAHRFIAGPGFPAGTLVEVLGPP